MPTYQYACTTCDHRFEAVQSFSDSSLSECPECSGILRKVFSSVGIVFKGSGFYRTDSRAGAVAKGEKATVGASASESSSSKDGATSKNGSSSTNGSGGKESSSSASSASSGSSSNSGSSASAAAAS